SLVKIPGFVIPLEGDANTVTEFYWCHSLVHVSMCRHRRPNQIVYVKFEKGAPVQELWDVVYVVGKLKTETISHDIAQGVFA
ncbi:DUF3299 domain-containing protein, partial [Grimontia hollisae]